MDINLLVNITSRAWCMAILDALGKGVPGRQASLLASTGGGRSAFTPSIMHLRDIGLLHRRSGHGHPLRPEFELSERGRTVARFAQDALDQATTENDRAVLRKTWAMPVIAVLAREEGFGEVRRALVPITDRALSQTLQLLEKVGWIERHVDVEARPPRSYYVTTGIGAQLSEVWLSHSEDA